MACYLSGSISVNLMELHFSKSPTLSTALICLCQISSTPTPPPFTLLFHTIYISLSAGILFIYLLWKVCFCATLMAEELPQVKGQVIRYKKFSKPSCYFQFSSGQVQKKFWTVFCMFKKQIWDGLGFYFSFCPFFKLLLFRYFSPLQIAFADYFTSQHLQKLLRNIKWKCRHFKISWTLSNTSIVKTEKSYKAPNLSQQFKQ